VGPSSQVPAMDDRAVDSELNMREGAGYLTGRGRKGSLVTSPHIWGRCSSTWRLWLSLKAQDPGSRERGVAENLLAM
jgi:hypothetical protein